MPYAWGTQDPKTKEELFGVRLRVRMEHHLRERQFLRQLVCPLHGAQLGAAEQDLSGCLVECCSSLNIVYEHPRLHTGSPRPASDSQACGQHVLYRSSVTSSVQAL